MSTSVIRNVRRYQKIFVGTTLCCILVCVIYEQLNFGAYSNIMRLSFVSPFVLAGAYRIAEMRKQLWVHYRGVRALLHSGIAVLISGSFVNGMMEVSGRQAAYIWHYALGGAAFIVLAYIHLQSRIEVKQ